MEALAPVNDGGGGGGGDGNSSDSVPILPVSIVLSVTLGSACFCSLLVGACLFFSVGRRRCAGLVVHPALTCFLIIGICVGLPLGLANSSKPSVLSSEAVVVTIALSVGFAVCVSYLFVNCWNSIPGLGSTGVLDFDESFQPQRHVNRLTISMVLCVVFALSIGLPLGMGGTVHKPPGVNPNGTMCTAEDVYTTCGLYTCNSDEGLCYTVCNSDLECTYFALCSGQHCVPNGKDYKQPIFKTDLVGVVAVAGAVVFAVAACGITSTLRADSTSPAIVAVLCWGISFTLILVPMSVSYRKFVPLEPPSIIAVVAGFSSVTIGVFCAFICTCVTVDFREIRTVWDVKVIGIGACGVWSCSVVGLAITLGLLLGGEHVEPPATASGAPCPQYDCTPFACSFEAGRCYDYCSSNAECLQGSCINGQCGVSPTTKEQLQSKSTLILGITLTVMLWAFGVCGVLVRILILRRANEYYLNLASED